jgi:hypothetical protein
VQQPLKGPGSEKTSPSPRTGTLATWRNAIAASDLPYPAGISLLAKFVLVVANKVAVGGLNPGDALPNVRDLKQICRSSAHPIRQALNLLKEIRLIDYLGGSTRDQDPNFVAAPPYSEPTLEAIRRSLPQSILPLLAAEVQKANERYAQQVPDSGVLPTSPTTQPPPTPPAAGNPKGAPISRTPPTGSPGQGHRGVGPPQ